jgi:hypothetical protein
VRTRLLTATLALALVFGISGCSDDGTSPHGTASVTVLLTDAPGDVSKAWVDLSEIYLQGGADGGGPVTLVTVPTDWIELTELAGQTLVLAEAADVPAGTYGQLRFRVDRAALLTTDGLLYATPDAGDLPPDPELDGLELAGTLHCPSCGQSGLKANMPGGALQAPGGGSTVVVLDLNVARSYGHEAGGSGRWVMHPEMDVTEMGFSGRIEGTVALADGVSIPDCDGEPRGITDFMPLATLTSTADAYTAAVNGDGTYAFPHLPPGSYEMSWNEVTLGDPPAWKLVFGAEVDATPADVTSGGATTVDYTITSAECVVY